MNEWLIRQISLTYGAVEQIACDRRAFKVSWQLVLIRFHSELKRVLGSVFGRLEDLTEYEGALDLGVLGQ